GLVRAGHLADVEQLVAVALPEGRRRQLGVVLVGERPVFFLKNEVEVTVEIQNFRPPDVARLLIARGVHQVGREEQPHARLQPFREIPRKDPSLARRYRASWQLDPRTIGHGTKLYRSPANAWFRSAEISPEARADCRRSSEAAKTGLCRA